MNSLLSKLAVHETGVERAEFQKAVIDTRAERHARGFTCWDQFVAMLFAQVGRAHSLREICGGLASCEGTLAHRGAAAPGRSTLAYANAHRPWTLYQTVCDQVLARCREVAGSKPFRFKNKLLSLDATVIDLCAEMFPWAVFRRTKGAVKRHVTLDHDGYLPMFLVITDGKYHEGPMARQQTFAAGTILVFDEGYTDSALHNHIWTGPIALLVLKYLQLKARFGRSLSNLVALLRMNLLVYRDLWAWLDEPFTRPPPLAAPVQGALTFTELKLSVGGLPPLTTANFNCELSTLELLTFSSTRSSPLPSLHPSRKTPPPVPA